MLLYQMAHLGGWEGPNLLPLSASSKVWFQNGKFQRWHPIIPYTKQRELSGGGHVFHYCQEQRNRHNHKCHGIKTWDILILSSPQIKKQHCPPEWWVDNPIHLLAVKNVLPAGGDLCGPATTLTRQVTFSKLIYHPEPQFAHQQMKITIATSQDCFAAQIK